VKYVLMFVDTGQFDAEVAAMSDADREQAYGLVRQWFTDNADKIKSQTHLMPAHTATTIRFGPADPVITDGPFVEGKEIISGFAEIDVANLDEALRLAKTWPACPLIEIRPIAG